MPATTEANDLFSQVEVAKILRIHRDTVRSVARGQHLTWKRSKGRVAKLLDRDDIAMLASFLDITPNWDAVEV